MAEDATLPPEVAQWLADPADRPMPARVARAIDALPAITPEQITALLDQDRRLTERVRAEPD